MEGYLLSVIIPTKNRYRYLIECIDTLNRIKSNKLEIIIQDNSDDNSEILDYISKLESSNVKYFHTTGIRSQTDNYNDAIANSTGEFVLGLGDDDSITSAAIKVAELMKLYDIDACNMNMFGYYWPDVFNHNFSKPPLSYDRRSPKLEKVITSEILDKYLSTGMQDLKYLPRIYHGILSRRVLNKIQDVSGAFCPGPSPDMANAVAASTFINWHLMLRYPIIVSGSAYNSAAGKGLRGEHTGSLSQVKQLPKNVEQGWDSKIPKVWLGNTIWPESAKQALKKVGHLTKADSLNYYPMYARVFIKHPEYRGLVLDNIKGFRSSSLLYFWCLREVCSWFTRTYKNKLKVFFGIEYTHKEIISLKKACEMAEIHLEKDINSLDRLFSNLLGSK
ncbi:glycosyltransferase family 2 protein [Vibrio variabilis]|uniref:glycosyltransferase family 2 protein n=1 Tax=Vibrio variabilis TaxID=990271 RepID=UPI000B1A1454|nr:glycosyltransferase family 2 protein [Vibrio variabilis]